MTEYMAGLGPCTTAVCREVREVFQQMVSFRADQNGEALRVLLNDFFGSEPNELGMRRAVMMSVVASTVTGVLLGRMVDDPGLVMTVQGGTDLAPSELAACQAVALVVNEGAGAAVPVINAHRKTRGIDPGLFEMNEALTAMAVQLVTQCREDGVEPW